MVKANIEQATSSGLGINISVPVSPASEATLERAFVDYRPNATGRFFYFTPSGSASTGFSLPAGLAIDTDNIWITVTRLVGRHSSVIACGAVAPYRGHFSSRGKIVVITHDRKSRKAEINLHTVVIEGGRAFIMKEIAALYIGPPEQVPEQFRESVATAVVSCRASTPKRRDFNYRPQSKYAPVGSGIYAL